MLLQSSVGQKQIMTCILYIFANDIDILLPFDIVLSHQINTGDDFGTQGKRQFKKKHRWKHQQHYGNHWRSDVGIAPYK